MSQAAFDAFMLRQNPRYKPSDDGISTREAWATWQAATELAAQICDRLTFAIDHGGNKYHRPSNAQTCAAAIRGQDVTPPTP